MYAILFILAIGCSSAPNRYSTGFDLHIKEFEKHCNCTVDVPIYFTRLSGKRVGECRWFRGPKAFRSIHIDPDYWSEADEYQRESLMFHELGHCILNRDHDESNKDGVLFSFPRSVMHPYVFDEYKYMREYYIKELIHPEKLTRARPENLSVSFSPYDACKPHR